MKANNTPGQEINNILIDVWVAGHDYASRDGGLEALREANQKGITLLSKAEQAITALIQRKQLEAKIDEHEQFIEHYNEALKNSPESEEVLKYNIMAHELRIKELTKELKEK